MTRPLVEAGFIPPRPGRPLRESVRQSDMSRAIANRELRLHYQPIVKLQTDAIVGYEALVRWQHPRRGLLAPCEFLPAAQRSEIGADIVKQGHGVMGDASQQEVDAAAPSSSAAPHHP